MKALAICGSPRKDGNTSQALGLVLEEMAAAGHQTEILSLAGKKLRGCISCYKCMENKDRRCAVKNDDMNEIIEAMDQADAIILGSPVYFSGVTAEMKAVIDRAGYVGRVNGYMYKRKVGAVVAVARRAGAVSTMDCMNHFILYHQFVTMGSSYWPIAFGRDKGDVMNDAEGVETMRNLGKNLAWLLEKFKG